MDIIKERIEMNLCPICAKVTVDTKTVKHVKYGDIKICEHHHVDKRRNK